MLLGSRDGILYIRGAIFAYEDTDILEAAVLAAFAAGNRIITLDMHEVKYMDAAALGTLVKVYNAVTGKNGQVRIVGAHGIVWELICLAKLDQIMNVYGRQNSTKRSIKRRFYKIGGRLRNS